jgi:hypothetical protein
MALSAQWCRRASHGTTTGFHADVAVLDQIQTTDTGDATDAVQLSQHGGRAHLSTIGRHDVARRDRSGSMWVGVLGAFSGRPAPHVFFVLGPGVFQHAAAFARRCVLQQVGKSIELWRLLLTVTLDRDGVLLGVVHQLFTGQQIPAPRGDYAQASSA